MDGINIPDPLLTKWLILSSTNANAVESSARISYPLKSH